VHCVGSVSVAVTLGALHARGDRRAIIVGAKDNANEVELRGRPKWSIWPIASELTLNRTISWVRVNSTTMPLAGMSDEKRRRGSLTIKRRLTAVQGYCVFRRPWIGRP